MAQEIIKVFSPASRRWKRVKSAEAAAELAVKCAELAERKTGGLAVSVVLTRRVDSLGRRMPGRTYPKLYTSKG